MNILQNEVKKMEPTTINSMLSKNQRYPIMFYTANAEYNQENILNRTFSRHQILLVLDGKGTLICGTASYHLKRGCAFFIAGNVCHSYTNDGNLITAFLTVLGPAADALAAEFAQNGLFFTENANIEKQVADIAEIITKYKNGESQGKLSIITYSFFVNFLLQQKSDVPEWLEEITKYIHLHLSEKLTLEYLASLKFVSVSKLCHSFKKHYSVSVFEYIMDVRLQYAHDLLRDYPQITTKEAASVCGFFDSGYFCKAYRKKYGRTPTEEKRGLS
jgi:AraC-like DNA-binding protein